MSHRQAAKQTSRQAARTRKGFPGHLWPPFYKSQTWGKSTQSPLNTNSTTTAMNSLVSICPIAFPTCTLPDLYLKPHFLGLPCHSGPRLLLPRGGGQQRLEGGLPPHQLRLPVLQPHLRRLRRARAGQLQVRRLHRRQVVLHRPQLRHLLPGPDPISKVPCQPLVLRGLRHPHHRLLRVPCSCGSCHRCCLRSL